MGLDNREQQMQCPCCDTCKDCSDFKKIIDLKDAGLVIYRHTTRTEDVNKNTGLLETATNITEDVFILHNTKDVEISSVDFVPALEQNKINCPRCRNIVEHAQKLLKKVPTIDKQDITGVCDHCRRKERSHTPCCECAKIVKKFVNSKDDKSDNTKRVKYWLSKIKHLLQDIKTDTEDSKKEIYRTRSELYINTLSLDTPRPVHEPVIKQLFHPETDKHDVIQTIPQPMQNVDKRNDAHSYCYQPYLQKLDESIIFIDSARHTEKLTPSQEASLAVKDDTVNTSSMTKSIFDGKYYKTRDRNTPEKSRLGRGLITPMTQFQEYDGQRQQKRLLSEFSNSNLEAEVGSPLQIEDVYAKTGAYLRRFEKQHKVTLEDDMAANRDETYHQQRKLVPSTKSLEDIGLVKDMKPSSFAKSYRDKSFQQQPYHNKTQTVTAKTDTQRGLETSSQIKKYHSEETLLTSVVGVTDDFLNKDFKYFFPKEISKAKKPKQLISSAELIKETQDMLLERAKEEKERFEEERRKWLVEEEKKRIANEEKKKLAEEKKKAEDERLKLTLEDQKRKAEEDTILVGEQKKEAVKNKNKFDQKSIKDAIQYEEKRVISDKKKKSLTPSVTGTTVKSKSEKSNASKSKGELKEKIDKDATKADSAVEKLKKGKDGKGHNDKKKSHTEYKQNEKDHKKRPKEENTEQSHMGKETKQKERTEIQRKHEKEDNQFKKGLLKQPEIPGNEVAPNEQTKGKADQGDDELKMLLIEQAKQKDADLKRKKQQEQSEKIAREAAIRKAKDSEERKYSEKEGTVGTKPELENEKSKQGNKIEIPTTKELNINQIKVRRNSADDLILQLVKVKQSDPHTERIKPNRLSELKISPVLIEEHKEHRNKKQSTCLMCIDSDLELDVESLVLKTDKSKEIADIIIGPNIFKYRPPLVQNKEEEGVVPLIFQSLYNGDVPVVKDKEILATIPEEPGRKPLLLPTKSAKTTDQEAPKGIVRYALSDRTFIEKGWTLLPTEKVVRKMNVYRMRPAHPEFDWFEHNKNKRLMLYDTGEKLAEFDDKGRGRWYYRNGRLALDYYDAEESNAQQRFVVYSSGEPDERGRTHPITILATFDYLGNGIVFNHGGKIRLKYNQTEGVILDRSIGPVSHWKWHSLNDPPVLQQVMIDTQMAHKDPDIIKMGGSSDNKTRPDNEEMLAIEFDNFIKEKSKKLTQTFKPFQIKMKALKINEHFSLKVLDQATVYLIFRDGTTNLKLNIGMILDHKEIVDTDTAELGEVSNNLERFPARTESLAALQRSVAYVQRFERSRNDRERRLRPAEPCASADQLTAAASRPLRPPLRSVKAGSTATTQDCYCKCSRKPSSFNLYYDNRLI